MGFSTPTTPYYGDLGATLNLSGTSSVPMFSSSGFYTYGNRFVDLRVKLTSGTSANFTVYLYNSQSNDWILYTDVPETTLYTANGGGVFQIEPRTAQRVYLRYTSGSGSVTASIFAYGITY